MLKRKKADAKAAAREETKDRASSPFMNGDASKDDRYMNLAAAAHNWRVAFRIVCALLAISMGFNGYYMLSSKYVPYIVEVDKIGHVVSVGPANRATPIDKKRVEREQITQWVENARLIVGDQAAQKRFISWVYARVQEGSKAKRALDRFQAERKPFEVASSYTVAPTTNVALAVSDNTYQVEWTEIFYAPNGNKLREEHWKGVFSFAIEPLSTDEGIRANGVGFFVTDFTWSKVSG
ncbi:hypothetical protein LMG19282_01484 [Cupriavidus campinensis]|uniref:Type IV secretion system protein n=1 Tax=Cupriavidus campinensis TaxID=151783 RepID=A0ABY3EJ84_9BURK|nr:type IV secretion system protein [Cupriavidus campinensis]TSP10990.1 type IV secretion system protein [Cupriavidus campinensis]CAG2138357.1 hypothetical protein LMG19282_01484 [Cupriavidus campinensis]